MTTGRFTRSFLGDSCTRRSGGYSSGYSDGGGGREAADDVYDIVDSDEEHDVDVEADSNPQVNHERALYCTRTSSWYS